MSQGERCSTCGKVTPLVIHSCRGISPETREREERLNGELLHGLTVWTGAVSMQIRDFEVALHVMDDAPRSTEDGHPVLLSPTEARLIRDLLNVATARGYL